MSNHRVICGFSDRLVSSKAPGTRGDGEISKCGEECNLMSESSESDMFSDGKLGFFVQLWYHSIIPDSMQMDLGLYI